MAGKVTVDRVLHQPCITDFSGLSTYGLKAYIREMSTPPTLLTGMAFFTVSKGSFTPDVALHVTMIHTGFGVKEP